MVDTIFALSSGVGRAAIAVVRLSGPGVRAAMATLSGGVPKPRMAGLRTLRSPGGEVLDHALVLFFPAPRSETGEDVGELHLHGSRAVVQGVLQALSALPGLRPAEAGEFARRALLNGKMDLLDVEALADLIDADTDAQRRQALAGGGSVLRRVAEQWREAVLSLRAELSASIDFDDEDDIAQRLDSKAERILRELIAVMESALSDAKRGEMVRQGFRVVLAGAPNAGKSSLMNALARRDVAIVSSVPGTTRDRLEVAFEIDGLPIILTDTAGVRASVDEVEQEGIRRAEAAMQTADLVLWLSPADAPQPPPVVPAECRVVGTKSDLGEQPGCWRNVSTVDSSGLTGLLGGLGAEASRHMGGEPVLLVRERHVAAIRDARAALSQAVGSVGEPEICSEWLRLAENRLERLLGRIDVEDVLGDIFSRFCIGK